MDVIEQTVLPTLKAANSQYSDQQLKAFASGILAGTCAAVSMHIDCGTLREMLIDAAHSVDGFHITEGQQPGTSNRRKRLYISGPMTGLPEYNYPAFHAAARDLRAAGYLVSNPAERSLPADAPWIEHMRKNIRMMADCDGIAMLDGWQHSKGANAEINLFHNLGLPVFSLVAWLPLVKPSKSAGDAA